MVFFNEDHQFEKHLYPYDEKEQQIRNKIIEIVKELSEEDLFFLMEILQCTVRT